MTNSSTPVNSSTTVSGIFHVLQVRIDARCECGWSTSYDHEVLASLALDAHRAGRCDGCAENIDHDSATVLDQDTYVGAFCDYCAPRFAAV